jgi:cholesterol transport system auxiliary component
MSAVLKAGAVLAGVAMVGCALTSKAEAVYPHFYSPEPEAVAPPQSTSSPLTLRLGQVNAASYVEERFAYRVAPTELSYYEDRRWTESPEQYLRRALERELFENRGIHRVVSGPGPTLDVELTAFEELQGKPARVRLALTFSLHDDRQAQLQRSLVVERPLTFVESGAPAREVTAALTLALAAAVSDVSEQVAGELAPRPPEPCGTPP